MHFQTPPFDHIKIVYVPFGRIVDVILDLRKFSTTFKESFSVELSGENGKILIIPKGLANVKIQSYQKEILYFLPWKSLILHFYMRNACEDIAYRRDRLYRS